MRIKRIYSVTVKSDIPLRYRCEFCGRDVTYIVPFSTGYSWEAGAKGASSLDAQKVNSKLLRETVKLMNEDEVYTAFDSYGPVGKCKYCGKEQRWAKMVIEGDLGENKSVLAGISVFLVLGIIIVSAFNKLLPIDAISSTTLRFLIFLPLLAAAIAAAFGAGKAVKTRIVNNKRKEIEEYKKSVDAAVFPRACLEQASEPELMSINYDAGEYFKTINGL